MAQTWSKVDLGFRVFFSSEDEKNLVKVAKGFDGL